MPAAARPSSAVIRDFAHLSRADVDLAGGKGANLGELTAAGLPVPGGFVVCAPTYAAFLDANGLRERIGELLDGLDVDDTAALDRRSAEVRAAIGGARSTGEAQAPAASSSTAPSSAAVAPE